MTHPTRRITAEHALGVSTHVPPRHSSGPINSTRGGALVTGRSSTEARFPEPAADKLHGWVFGCDICQDVCPWNRKAPPGHEIEFEAFPEWQDPDLLQWLMMSECRVDEQVGGSGTEACEAGRAVAQRRTRTRVPRLA